MTDDWQTVDETDLRRVLRSLSAGTKKAHVARLCKMSKTKVSGLVDLAAARYWSAAQQNEQLKKDLAVARERLAVLETELETTAEHLQQYIGLNVGLLQVATTVRAMIAEHERWLAEQVELGRAELESRVDPGVLDAASQREEDLRRERDEARKAARWLLNLAADRNHDLACQKWPWLEVE